MIFIWLTVVTTMTGNDYGGMIGAQYHSRSLYWTESIIMKTLSDLSSVSLQCPETARTRPSSLHPWRRTHICKQNTEYQHQHSYLLSSTYSSCHLHRLQWRNHFDQRHRYTWQQNINIGRHCHYCSNPWVPCAPGNLNLREAPLRGEIFWKKGSGGECVL